MLPEAVGGIVDAIISERWSALAAPGAAALAGATTDYFRKRYTRARAILEIEFGKDGSAGQVFRNMEEFAAAAIRYERAVRDQAADENLRILAKAMIGLAQREELWANDFLKYAEIVVALSRDELIVLGALMAEDKKIGDAGNSEITPRQAWAAAVQTLLSVFPSADYLTAIAVRAQRSGLIFAPTSTYGGPSYQLSPIGREVRDIADINAALGDDDGVSRK